LSYGKSDSDITAYIYNGIELSMKSFILFLMVFFTMNVVAQGDTLVVKQPTDTTLYRIIKDDGKEFIGRIIKQDEREILVQLQSGRSFYIPQYVVKEIVPVRREDIAESGEFMGEDRFATRYFLTTNGLPIKKGEHYVQWNLFGPDFQFGVGENFGVGVMTSWMAIPIIGTAKYSFKLGEKVQGGVGTMLGTSSWAALFGSEGNIGMALPFGTVSSGSRKSNIAFSSGYGAVWADGEAQGRALFSVAGMVRVGPKLSFVFDSFIMTRGKDRVYTYTSYQYNPSTGNYDPVLMTGTESRPGFALIIPGLRWHQGEGKAFQFGFTGVVANGEMWQIPIPMVQWYRSL
jgi:hypothetical protein